MANTRDDIVISNKEVWKVKQVSAEQNEHIKTSLAWQQFTKNTDKVSDIIFCMYNTYIHVGLCQIYWYM